MYDARGREIRPRNGLLVKAGSMVYRNGEWHTLECDHVVKIVRTNNGLCQSVETETKLEPKPKTET